ncbi:MAG: hypothetical protein M1812_000425 [Candelaria pacifica]|nr:MAG: hypothetical protein M1812_000425 [Candelaria pacifica]
MAPLNKLTTCKAKSTSSIPRQERAKLDTELRFAVPYFAHEALDPKLYHKNTRGAIGGPSPVEGRRDHQDVDSGDELADPSSDEEDGHHDLASQPLACLTPQTPGIISPTGHTGRKRSNSTHSTIRERKKMRVEGGRTAIPKKIVADVDSEDEIIVRMKEEGFTDSKIRDHLISEGRTKYNSKTISSRWGRLRRVLEARNDQLLDEQMIDWHAGEDELLLEAVVKANAEVDHRKEKIEAQRWKFVADCLRKLKPTASYSKNACQTRFEALQDGTASIPPELDDNPEKRAAEMAARTLEKEEKVQANAKLTEDLARGAVIQEANPIAAHTTQNQVSATASKDVEAPRKPDTGGVEVTWPPNVSGPETNSEDDIFEAQGFSTDNSALTFVHPAAAANLDIGERAESAPDKEPSEAKKGRKAKLPKKEAKSKSSLIEEAPVSTRSTVPQKAMSIHHSSKPSKADGSALASKADPTTKSSQSVITLQKPGSNAKNEPTATITSAAEVQGGLPSSSPVTNKLQADGEPTRAANLIAVPKVAQGEPPKQTKMSPALSTNKGLALTLAKDSRKNLTHVQMRAEPRARKISQVGTKQEMADRLDAADEINATKAVTISTTGAPPEAIKIVTTDVPTSKIKAKHDPTKAVPQSKAKVSTSTASEGDNTISTPGRLPRTIESNASGKVKKSHKKRDTPAAIPNATNLTMPISVATENPLTTNKFVDVVAKDPETVESEQSQRNEATTLGPSHIIQPTTSRHKNPIKEGRRLELSNVPKDITESAIRNLFQEYSIDSIDSRCCLIGIVLVDLDTQADAVRAVKELSGKELSGSTVKLELIHGFPSDAAI